MTDIYFAYDTCNNTQASIKVDLTYLRFLILKDKMFGSITVSTGDESITYGEHLEYHYKIPTNYGDETVHNFSGWYYNSEKYKHDYGSGVVGTEEIGFESVSVYLSDDFSKILLFHSGKGITESSTDKRYIGNIEENQEKETAEFFAGFHES